jgi:predicted anti-sigma-YlaC factor YlaD
VKDVLDCARAEELFSDYREGELPAPLRADMETHLSTCSDCRALLVAMGEVLDVLRSPLDLDPSAALSARVAAASWRPAAARVIPFRPTLRLPARIQSLAAGLALLSTVSFLLLQNAPPRPGRVALRVKERTVNAAVYMQERAERLVEDLRMLRVVVATAFEGRVDRVNDRVDDYRRLLERRRQHPPEGRESQSGPDTSRAAHHLRTAKRFDA